LKNFLVADFDYHLPAELIAEYPLATRSSSRLLCLDKNSGAITHRTFKDLLTFLTPKDLIIFNDTKVIPARLYAYKPTGGKVEIMLERILSNKVMLAQTKASKAIKVGTKLIVANDIFFEVIACQENLFKLLLHSTDELTTVLAKFGQTPLPPYIKHQPTIKDASSYQTIYAKNPGAVAAPTAGLHFDQTLFASLNKRKIPIAFVTLHVGLGTFQPLRVTKITEHQMHPEYLAVSAPTCHKIIATKENGGRIIAVGTTSARGLETISSNGVVKPYTGETNLFIYPSYNFKIVDLLITNFHLPKSTLLLLVSAFAGYDNIKHAYEEAIKERYRFYSYGDAMLIF
jgi:S-adenosylmethionine:tRNA ribosyltransferase-isomerase